MLRAIIESLALFLMDAKFKGQDIIELMADKEMARYTMIGSKMKDGQIGMTAMRSIRPDERRNLHFSTTFFNFHDIRWDRQRRSYVAFQ